MKEPYRYHDGYVYGPSGKVNTTPLSTALNAAFSAGAASRDAQVTAQQDALKGMDSRIHKLESALRQCLNLVDTGAIPYWDGIRELLKASKP